MKNNIYNRYKKETKSKMENDGFTLMEDFTPDNQRHEFINPNNERIAWYLGTQDPFDKDPYNMKDTLLCSYGYVDESKTYSYFSHNKK